MRQTRRALQKLQAKTNQSLTELSTSGLSDVSDSDTPVVNDVLKYDGEEFIYCPYTQDLSFSIASFSDAQSTTQLIGSGVWKAIGALTFTASYNNGPPDSAVVSCASWVGDLTMGSSGSGPTSSTEATNYPGAVAGTITFTLTADGEEDTESVTFYNNVYYGVSTTADTYDDADIDGMTPVLQSAITHSGFTAAPEANEYVLYAHRNSGGAIAQFRCGTGANLITAAFDPADATAVTPAYETVSHSNSAGFTENFKVYRSLLQNLDAHSDTVVASSSATAINYIFYGVTETASSFSEADIEGLATKSSSNDNTIEFTVTPGASEYIAFAYPKRLGEVTFWVGGFEGGFEDAETVAVTNPAGFQEDYYIYRSTNTNLGETTVTTEEA